MAPRPIVFVQIFNSNMAPYHGIEWSTKALRMWPCSGLQFLPEIRLDGTEGMLTAFNFSSDIDCEGFVDVGHQRNEGHCIVDTKLATNKHHSLDIAVKL
jgi:hypothetical protein